MLITIYNELIILEGSKISFLRDESGWQASKL